MAPQKTDIYTIFNSLAKVSGKDESSRKLFFTMIGYLGNDEELIRYCNLEAVKLYMKWRDENHKTAEPGHLYQAIKSNDLEKIKYFLGRSDSEYLLNRVPWLPRAFDNSPHAVLKLIQLKYIINPL